MPLELIERECRDAFAIVTTQWRYGDLKDLPKLRAILEVGGRHPSPASIDYDHCRVKGIRVLSCAPAFGPMVAEMALGMAIDAAREITAGHEAFRAGEEKYLWDGNETTFTLYGETVGFIGFGGLAQCLKPLLAPFGCRLIAHDPWRTDQYLKDQGAEPVGLDELLSSGRVIFVLTIPSTNNKAQIGPSGVGADSQGCRLRTHEPRQCRRLRRTHRGVDGGPVPSRDRRLSGRADAFGSSDPPRP